uniref:Murine leukemia virus integrase C-terminal domain-containing protein n=1 Tax=Terrapene triunguis TaxID=2587831 RepID=A0A674JCU4_9SAUR
MSQQHCTPKIHSLFCWIPRVHSLQPGDSVLVRTWKDEPLQEKWKGPHTILLVTHTAAKVEGHKNWIHHSRLKAVPAPEQWTVQPAEKTANDDLGLKLLFKRQGNSSVTYCFTHTACRMGSHPYYVLAS